MPHPMLDNLIGSGNECSRETPVYLRHKLFLCPQSPFSVDPASLRKPFAYHFFRHFISPACFCTFSDYYFNFFDYALIRILR